MSTTLSPYMNLPIAGVGSEPGPDYAFDANSSFTLLDMHDHSPGRGVQITPAGLNINATLDIQVNNIINVNDIVFSQQASNSTLLGLYVAPGTESPQALSDLWFNDSAGNAIQLTAGGAVNATIANLPGESFAFGTFFWKQGAGSTVPANFDIGSITLRPNVAATTYGVTVSPPSGLSTAFTINLPNLPSGSAFLTIDNSGVMASSVSTAGGITGSNIAPLTITGANIANATITPDKLSAGINFVSQQFDTYTPSFTVRAATTVNGTLSTAFDNGSVIDGITLATNDLILIKNQNTASDDGVYVVQASGVPVRDTSYDTFSELNYAGVIVSVGTANAGKHYYQNNVLTSLSDAQSWSLAATQLFTVPTGVTSLTLQGIGGGAGGGLGSDGNGSDPGVGGTGGAGAVFGYITVTVTPGQDIAITQGLGGAASSSGTDTIVGSLISFRAARGGTAAPFNGGASAMNGASSAFGVGGVAGANSDGPGGGGGGGGYGTGGNGGVGGQNSVHGGGTGVAAAALTGAGGGGGGGGAISGGGSTIGGAGGAGGSGFVIVSYTAIS